MTELGVIEQARAAIANELRGRGKPFALVGGLAVSVRAEVRFTRDVDIAVAVGDDAEAERLVLDLNEHGLAAVRQGRSRAGGFDSSNALRAGRP